MNENSELINANVLKFKAEFNFVNQGQIRKQLRS